MGLTFAAVGFVAVLAAITWYFSIISAETVPKSVGPFAGVLIGGIVVADLGVALAPSVATALLAGLTLLLGGSVLYLLPLRKLPDGELVARIGEPMPPLVALDQDGERFDLTSLRGQRVMVKFFRGSW